MLSVYTAPDDDAHRAMQGILVGDRRMTSWTGNLFVFEDHEGQEYVSTADPALGGTSANNVRVYSVRGPYAPIGWRQAVPVRDASAWMGHLEKEGFYFEFSLH
jgi:hypothetical protein